MHVAIPAPAPPEPSAHGEHPDKFGPMKVEYDPFSELGMTDPRDVYAQLRAEDPVHYMKQYDAWALASFEAVWQACMETSSFSMRKGPIPYQVLLGEPASDLTFAGLDPPQHRLRRRVLRASTHREAAAAEEVGIRAIAREVLATLRDQMPQGFDVYTDYAHEVAGRFAAIKAGVPQSDAYWLRDTIGASFERLPGQRGTSESNLSAIMQTFGYLHELVIKGRADPSKTTGALAVLLAAEVEGVALTDEQVSAELHTLMVTGADTTEFGVAATLYYLAREPAQQREVLDEPRLSLPAFAEALRYDHPTEMLCRTVAQDIVIGGRRAAREPRSAPVVGFGEP